MDKLYDLNYNPKTGFISAQKLYLKLNKEVPISQSKSFLNSKKFINFIKKKSKTYDASNDGRSCCNALAVGYVLSILLGMLTRFNWIDKHGLTIIKNTYTIVVSFVFCVLRVYLNIPKLV